MGTQPENELKSRHRCSSTLFNSSISSRSSSDYKAISTNNSWHPVEEGFKDLKTKTGLNTAFEALKIIEESVKNTTFLHAKNLTKKGLEFFQGGRQTLLNLADRITQTKDKKEKTQLSLIMRTVLVLLEHIIANQRLNDLTGVLLPAEFIQKLQPCDSTLITEKEENTRSWAFSGGSAEIFVKKDNIIETAQRGYVCCPLQVALITENTQLQENLVQKGWPLFAEEALYLRGDMSKLNQLRKPSEEFSDRERLLGGKEENPVRCIIS